MSASHLCRFFISFPTICPLVSGFMGFFGVASWCCFLDLSRFSLLSPVFFPVCGLGHACHTPCHTHTHIYIYIHIQLYAHVCVCVHTDLKSCLHTPTHVHNRAHLFADVHEMVHSKAHEQGVGRQLLARLGLRTAVPAKFSLTHRYLI